MGDCWFGRSGDLGDSFPTRRGVSPVSKGPDSDSSTHHDRVRRGETSCCRYGRQGTRNCRHRRQDSDGHPGALRDREG